MEDPNNSVCELHLRPGLIRQLGSQNVNADTFDTTEM